ncbi:RebB family R body protein [Nitrospirillum sp. BR 11164]|uniref:RebB family R body protein n=1 Tax=Nitrospirillum sp. BR 11164 TaxID=3104324 RepID=UPI002AFEE110|nr:RebB family R body protein [Nitrospirillum sp. BR 11164]MEA1652036.1 RebB family R body protein [Nitrospirillum sp. BR 11164]
MAFPTAVNSQITDSVTQSNVKVVGETPAQAEGEAVRDMAESTGTSADGAAPAVAPAKE